MSAARSVGQCDTDRMNSFSGMWGAIIVYALVVFAPSYMPEVDKVFSAIFRQFRVVVPRTHDPFAQSARERAFVDTRAAIHQVWFWFAEIVSIPLVVGIVLTWFTGSVGDFWINLYGAGVAIATIFGVLALTYGINLLLATSKQRDESRTELVNLQRSNDDVTATIMLLEQRDHVATDGTGHSLLDIFRSLARSLSTNAGYWEIERILNNDFGIIDVRNRRAAGEVIERLAIQGVVIAHTNTDHTFDRPRTVQEYSLTELGRRVALELEVEK